MRYIIKRFPHLQDVEPKKHMKYERDLNVREWAKRMELRAGFLA